MSTVDFEISKREMQRKLKGEKMVLAFTRINYENELNALLPLMQSNRHLKTLTKIILRRHKAATPRFVVILAETHGL